MEISNRDIKLAVSHMMGGKALVHCPDCCRVLVLPDDVPEGAADLEEWVIVQEQSDDWCPCISLLNDEEAKLPGGVIENVGKKLYRPGEGSGLYSKREYMLRFE